MPGAHCRNPVAQATTFYKVGTPRHDRTCWTHVCAPRSGGFTNSCTTRVSEGIFEGRSWIPRSAMRGSYETCILCVYRLFSSSVRKRLNSPPTTSSARPERDGDSEIGSGVTNLETGNDYHAALSPLLGGGDSRLSGKTSLTVTLSRPPKRISPYRSLSGYSSPPVCRQAARLAVIAARRQRRVCLPALVTSLLFSLSLFLSLSLYTGHQREAYDRLTPRRAHPSSGRATRHPSCVPTSSLAQAYMRRTVPSSQRIS